MFRYPLEITEDDELNSHEKRILKQKFAAVFNISEEDLCNIFTRISVIQSVRIRTRAKLYIQVYIVDKVPLGFVWNDVICPTVFLLWKYPKLFHSFTTDEKVTAYIKSGADLMVPGVCFPSRSVACSKNRYGKVKKGQIVYINLTKNKAAYAVGAAAQSSEDMLNSGGLGKCVLILHFYGDELCKFKGLSLPYPELGSPTVEKEEPKPKDLQSTTTTHEAGDSIDAAVSVTEDDEPNFCQIDTVEDMDRALELCFFVAVKYSKTLSLPILVSKFYKTEMLPLTPADTKLDIKKSSFKTLKTFFDLMHRIGIIVVKDMGKGVHSIVGINRENNRLQTFYVDPYMRPMSVARKESTESTESDEPVKEKFVVTLPVYPIFVEEGYRIGDTLLLEQIKYYVMKYIENNNLLDPESPRLVKPNKVISKICKTPRKVSRERLLNGVLSKMKKRSVQNLNQKKPIDGELPKIIISVAAKSSEKNVTHIDNLELYKMNLVTFSKDCMRGVSASTSISKPLGKKFRQLMLQGNHVPFVYKLLTEKYKIPRECIVRSTTGPVEKPKSTKKTIR